MQGSGEYARQFFLFPTAVENESYGYDHIGAPITDIDMLGLAGSDLRIGDPFLLGKSLERIRPFLAAFALPPMGREVIDYGCLVCTGGDGRL